jgi:hypothetical protein
MSLQSLLAEGKLRRHRTSAKEIADLLRVVDRDLADAAIAQTSADRRFATAYNAALALATVVLHAAGYRSAGLGTTGRRSRRFQRYWGLRLRRELTTWTTAAHAGTPPTTTGQG